MLIRNRSSFISGLILTLSFAGVLASIFAPVFGNGRNGLQYADDVFNRLSKGSSYFLPKLAAQTGNIGGEGFQLALVFQTDAAAAVAAVQYASVGLRAEADGQNLHVGGDLDQMLVIILRDAEDGYRNHDDVLRQRYGLASRTVLANWWQLLSQLETSLKSEKRIPKAKVIAEMMKKGVEPAHNYFGIPAENVTNMIPEMFALLAFYVLYTVWWGYGILKLMEGFGLVLKSH